MKMSEAGKERVMAQARLEKIGRYVQDVKEKRDTLSKSIDELGQLLWDIDVQMRRGR